jgi:hypothetical protein
MWISVTRPVIYRYVACDLQICVIYRFVDKCHPASHCPSAMSVSMMMVRMPAIQKMTCYATYNKITHITAFSPAVCNECLHDGKDEFLPNNVRAWDSHHHNTL